MEFQLLYVWLESHFEDVGHYMWPTVRAKGFWKLRKD